MERVSGGKQALDVAQAGDLEFLRFLLYQLPAQRSLARHVGKQVRILFFLQLSSFTLSDWSNTVVNDSPDNDADALNQSDCEKVIDNACSFISHALQYNKPNALCEFANIVIQNNFHWFAVWTLIYHDNFGHN